MDKEIISGNHTVNIVKRNSINISGVKKIENFEYNYIKGKYGAVPFLGHFDELNIRVK